MGPSEPPTLTPTLTYGHRPQPSKAYAPLVPVVLDFKSNVFPKWRTFFNIAVATYTLEDYLTIATPPTDTTVLCWLYGSMVMDIVDLAMPTSTAVDALVVTAYTVWTDVHGLFNDNKKTHEVYLAEEFRNVKQEDRSINEYLNLQKAATIF
jgi:hypothetical protein